MKEGRGRGGGVRVPKRDKAKVGKLEEEEWRKNTERLHGKKSENRKQKE